MERSQLNKVLSFFYIVCGLVIFFYASWEFLIRAAFAGSGLYLVSLGFKMQGYPVSRFLFMAQQWRSRF